MNGCIPPLNPCQRTQQCYLNLGPSLEYDHQPLVSQDWLYTQRHWSAKSGCQDGWSGLVVGRTWTDLPNEQPAWRLMTRRDWPVAQRPAGRPTKRAACQCQPYFLLCSLTNVLEASVQDCRIWVREWFELAAGQHARTVAGQSEHAFYIHTLSVDRSAFVIQATSMALLCN